MLLRRAEQLFSAELMMVIDCYDKKQKMEEQELASLELSALLAR